MNGIFYKFDRNRRIAIPGYFLSIKTADLGEIRVSGKS
jgi:hypothetical protein